MMNSPNRSKAAATIGLVALAGALSAMTLLTGGGDDVDSTTTGAAGPLPAVVSADDSPTPDGGEDDVPVVGSGAPSGDDATDHLEAGTGGMMAGGTDNAVPARALVVTVGPSTDAGPGANPASATGDGSGDAARSTTTAPTTTAESRPPSTAATQPNRPAESSTTQAPPATQPSSTQAPPSTDTPGTSPATTTTRPPTTQAPSNPEPATGARALEQQVIELTNDNRRQAGCPALTNNGTLHASALGHSQDMAANNYFSHTSLDGSSMRDRIERQGYQWRRIAENIASGYRTAESVVTGWMNSPGHRANILNCDLTEIGVGFHEYYWTQNFGTPR